MNAVSCAWCLWRTIWLGLNYIFVPRGRSPTHKELPLWASSRSYTLDDLSEPVTTAPVSAQIKRNSFPSLANMPLKFTGGKPGTLNIAVAVLLEVTNTIWQSRRKSRNSKIGSGKDLLLSPRASQNHIYFEQHRTSLHTRDVATQLSLLVPRTR